MAYDTPVTPGTWGGARPGSGPRKRDPDELPSPEEESTSNDYKKARARKEAALADLNELEFKIKSGEYIPRAAVQQASAELLSAVAQALRSLPDVLERKVALAPEAAEKVEEVIDAALADLAAGLEMFSGEA